MSERKPEFRYDKRSGRIVPADGARPGKGPKIHTTFKPFVSHQVDRTTARDLGLERLPRAKGGGTAFKSERELRKYRQFEAAHGRETHWKAHSEGE
jgi:hypothetical protein